MNASHFVLLANVAATLFMVGLIWMVQVVHYPLLDGVGEQNYVRYQQRHQSNITYVVGGALGDTHKPAMQWEHLEWEHLGMGALGMGALGDTHKPEPISPSLTPSDFDAVYLWDVFSFFGKTI